MDEKREPFIRGHYDYQVFAARRRLCLVPHEGYPFPWQPVVGHEDVYWLGWETAKQELARAQELRKAA